MRIILTICFLCATLMGVFFAGSGQTSGPASYAFWLWLCAAGGYGSAAMANDLVKALKDERGASNEK